MSIDLDDIAGTVDQYRAIKQQIAELEEAAETLKAMIIEQMDGEDVGVIDGQPVVKHITYDTSRFDTKGFQAAHPDIAAKFTKTTTASRFSLITEQR